MSNEHFEHIPEILKRNKLKYELDLIDILKHYKYLGIKALQSNFQMWLRNKVSEYNDLINIEDQTVFDRLKKVKRKAKTVFDKLKEFHGV